MLTAAAIMTDELVTIHPESTLKEAIENLLGHQATGLAVIDDDGHLVGIITEFALLAMAYDRDVRRQPVARHMTRDVICADVNTPLNRVADLFILHRIRQMPVLRNERLAGMISRRDVLQALYAAVPPVCTA
jgi:CBS domain-containing protein